MTHPRRGAVSARLLPQRRRAAIAGRGMGIREMFGWLGTPDAASARFLRTHLWWPLGAFVALALLLLATHANTRWADALFAWEGHRWALKSDVITEEVVHVGGRTASAIAWLGVVAAWFVARTRAPLAHWRRPLACLALSVMAATTAVAWLKSWSNMDCPWDLLRYGGDRPYIGLLQMRPIGLSRAACFPAGHASAGYAWVALYFFFLVARPQWRWRGLGIGIGSGLLFGFSQQLRGAHFLSHDLWTVAICWATALATYWLMYRNEFPHVVEVRDVAATSSHRAMHLVDDREPWALPS